MEAATMEERCLLLHSPWLAQIPPARGGTIHRELGPWHQLAIKKMLNRGQPDKSNSSAKALSSQVCQANNQN